MSSAAVITESMVSVLPKKRAVHSIVYGTLIGFIGAGDEMVMLLIFTRVLGYAHKRQWDQVYLL